jgi:hypothetical protein
MAQDKVQLQDLVNTVINIRVPKKIDNFSAK